MTGGEERRGEISVKLLRAPRKGRASTRLHPDRFISRLILLLSQINQRQRIHCPVFQDIMYHVSVAYVFSVVFDGRICRIINK